MIRANGVLYGFGGFHTSYAVVQSGSCRMFLCPLIGLRRGFLGGVIKLRDNVGT